MRTELFKNNIKNPIISYHYLFILLCMLYANIYYFAPSFRFYPAHDSMAWLLHFFYVYFNEYVTNGQISLWFPYNLFGYEVDYYLLAVMSPAQYFAMVVGKMLGLSNALLVLKLSMLIEQLAFITGVYMLSSRLFRHNLSTVFVCTVAVFTVFWGVQYGFNFRFYYLTPFILLLIIRFFDTGSFKYLWIGGAVAVISMLGNAPYYLPIYIIAYSGFFLTLLFMKGLKKELRFREIFSLSSILFLVIFTALLFVYMDFITHVLDNSVVYSWGRDSVTGRIDLVNFLQHGGQTNINGQYINGSGLDLLWQFLYASPRSIDFTIYIGLLPIVFLIYALFHVKTPYFTALMIVGIIFLLLSFAEVTFIAPLFYLFIPTMDYYRHISYLPILSKFFFIIALGFGIDIWLERKGSDSKWVSPAFIGAVLVGFIFFIDVFVLKGNFPYLAVQISALYLPLDYIISYRFHFFPLFILFFAVIYLLHLGHKIEQRHARVIVFLCFLEIASYNFALFHGMPVKSPGLSAETSFNIRKYAFQHERVDNEKMQILRPDMKTALNYFGTKNQMQYSAFYLDACPAEVFNSTFRVDAIPRSFNELVVARFGRKHHNPLQDNMAIKTMLSDHVFLRALGCNFQRLRVVSNPVVVSDMAKAIEFIQDSSDIDINPVVLTDSSHEYSVENDDAPHLAISSDPSLSKQSASVEMGWHHIEFQQKIGDREYPFWESNTGPPFWVEWKVKGGKKGAGTLIDYKLKADADPITTDRMPADWLLQGSNDGNIWADLDIRVNEVDWEPNEERTYNMAAPTVFTFYRLFVKDININKRNLGYWIKIKKNIKKLLGKHGSEKIIVRIGSIAVRFKDIIADMDVTASNRGLYAKSTPVKDFVENDIILNAALSANSLSVKVNAITSESWLVYLDNYHPGWMAEINGKSRPVARANIAFKAVKLDKGLNQVKFIFKGNHRTWLYSRIFLIIGVASCLILFALAILNVFRPMHGFLSQNVKR